MRNNLFDFLDDTLMSDGGSESPWAVRTPRRPHPRYDLRLTLRMPATDPRAVAALKSIEGLPWVDELAGDDRGTIWLRLSRDWIARAGAALEAGGNPESPLTDIADSELISLQFWDPNATKALHVGHLRNLSLGNALGSALSQAGARVERRSRISDTGRAMGEAMAGLARSGRDIRSWSGDQKSDHFIGVCYADYVASRDGSTVENTSAEDSLFREVEVQDDSADRLIKRVLDADPEAVELWYKTRAWVIAGQRKTLSRLGIAFDRVLFESDYLSETHAVVERGLAAGILERREDGVVVYRTGLEELEEMPLMRADGLSTQHLRSLTYALHAPALEGMTSLQVTGSEWVAHASSIRKLAAELHPELNGGFHPSRSIFHGMVADRDRTVTSSAGGLLIDDLADWLDAEIDNAAARHAVRRSHPAPERIAGQVVLGFFLPHPIRPDVEFDRDQMLRDGQSLGWDLARALARHGAQPPSGPALEDPDYRFAVVQSQLYRRHLRLAVERLDVQPLADYLKHLIAWYLERDRSEAVGRVMQTLLNRSARGLGLDATS